MSARFELVSQFANHTNLLPRRATKNSAGYDFIVAQDTTLPAFVNQSEKLYNYILGEKIDSPLDISEVAKITKGLKCKPTLVPTGVKAYIPEGYYL